MPRYLNFKLEGRAIGLALIVALATVACATSAPEVDLLHAMNGIAIHH